MKRFEFPLEKVLHYKNQILENLQNELSIIQMHLNEVEKKLNIFNAEYRQTNMKLREAYQKDITTKELSPYKMYLSQIDQAIRINEEKRAKIKEAFALKQKEVLEAKIEVSTLEKLREKQVAQYNEAVKKETEQFIDEFVNNTRASS